MSRSGCGFHLGNGANLLEQVIGNRLILLDRRETQRRQIDECDEDVSFPESGIESGQISEAPDKQESADEQRQRDRDLQNHESALEGKAFAPGSQATASRSQRVGGLRARRSKRGHKGENDAGSHYDSCGEAQHAPVWIEIEFQKVVFGAQLPEDASAEGIRQ